MKQFLLLFLISFSFSAFSQKYIPFEGKLVYSIEFTDSMTKQTSPKSFMTIYTNDTLVRIENDSEQLGKQVTIRHLTLNKYYILLEFDDHKFAIQHQGKEDTIPSKYEFKNKIGSKKIAGKKAKKVEVKSSNFSKPITMYYLKNMSPKYLEVLRGIKGLPVEYFIQNEDGMFHYELISITQEKVSLDNFGIPSNYQKVTFEDFINKVMQTN